MMPCWCEIDLVHVVVYNLQLISYVPDKLVANYFIGKNRNVNDFPFPALSFLKILSDKW